MVYLFFFFFLQYIWNQSFPKKLIQKQLIGIETLSESVKSKSQFLQQKGLSVKR